MPDQRTWREQAACRGVRRQVLYPEDNGFEVASPSWVEECAAVAARYCLRCPVRLPCYATAQEDEGEASRGVWGGVHFVDRRRMRSHPVRCQDPVCAGVLDPLIFLRTGEVPSRCPEHEITDCEDLCMTECVGACGVL